ncbi:MAG: hypothetical protein AAB461_02655 [Patescibacteria group bacterium]
MKQVGIVAFGFGVPETILSNRRIAQIASSKAREFGAPVYTQLDVRVESGIEVKYTEEEPGSPPPTLRIARGAVQWAKQHGFTRLWVVAAQPHLWRCLRDLGQAVREIGGQIDVRHCPEVLEYPEDSWFCPDSEQDRVSSREKWDKREKVLKLMPFFIYKCVAK